MMPPPYASARNIPSTVKNVSKKTKPTTSSSIKKPTESYSLKNPCSFPKPTDP